MGKEKSLNERVFTYLNGRPSTTRKGIMKAFKDESYGSIGRYYYMWVDYIKPLRWLYSFLINKWEPVKRITSRDKEALKRVEKLIGV